MCLSVSHSVHGGGGGTHVAITNDVLDITVHAPLVLTGTHPTGMLSRIFVRLNGLIKTPLSEVLDSDPSKWEPLVITF